MYPSVPHLTPESPAAQSSGPRREAQSPGARREALKRLWEEARVCRDCLLHETRTQVVFGSGNADANLMFVGEAPGRSEDERGIPFVGQAGKLLDQLLDEIGLERRDVFIVNTLKCRPPNNRDPHPPELASCEKYLYRQIELIQPTVIATLGNFATKLLRGDPTGITRIHGQAEERLIGPRRVRLLPLLHPAAALYTRSMVEVLREDFAQLPALLELGPPDQPQVDSGPQIRAAPVDGESPAPPHAPAASSAVAPPAQGPPPASQVASSASSGSSPTDGAETAGADGEQLGLF